MQRFFFSVCNVSIFRQINAMQFNAARQNLSTYFHAAKENMENSRITKRTIKWHRKFAQFIPLKFSNNF